MVVTMERVTSEVENQGKMGQASSDPQCPLKTNQVLLAGFQRTDDAFCD